MAQGVNPHVLLVDARLADGVLHGPLHAADRHGVWRFGRVLAVAAQGREEQSRMPVSLPVGAQHRQRPGRQRNVAVLGPLAAVDMEHHPVAVDIRGLQMQRLLKAPATGIDGGEEGAVMKGVDAREHPAHLLSTQHRRQPELLLGAQIVEGAPVALKHMGEEKANPRMGDPHGVRRPFIDVPAMKEVILQLCFRDLIRRLVKELHQLAHGSGVGLLGAVPLAGQLQGAHRFFVPVGHSHVLLFFPSKGK